MELAAPRVVPCPSVPRLPYGHAKHLIQTRLDIVIPTVDPSRQCPTPSPEAPARACKYHRREIPPLSSYPYPTRQAAHPTHTAATRIRRDRGFCCQGRHYRHHRHSRRAPDPPQARLRSAFSPCPPCKKEQKPPQTPSKPQRRRKPPTRRLLGAVFPYEARGVARFRMSILYPVPCVGL